MSKLDIEKLAIQAGIIEQIDLLPSNQWAQDMMREIGVFAALVLEEAAKVCEFQADRFMQGAPLEGNKPYAAHECAAAIRALAKELE